MDSVRVGQVAHHRFPDVLAGCQRGHQLPRRIRRDPFHLIEFAFEIECETIVDRS